MNVALRQPPMTRAQFLDWVARQEARYEFDGFQPVAMTGGTRNHSRITVNVLTALSTRLRGTPCEPLGPDAGVATVRDAIRYPDAVVSCNQTPGDARVVTAPVAVFEVLSPTSGRVDRIDKLREYAAVDTICRYVILEHSTIGASVFMRDAAGEPFKATALTAEDVLVMPELGIEIPLAEFYERIDFPSVAEDG